MEDYKAREVRSRKAQNIRNMFLLDVSPNKNYTNDSPYLMLEFMFQRPQNIIHS